MIEDLKTAGDFNSFLIHQSELLGKSLSKFGLNLNEHMAQVTLMQLIRWAINLGAIDISQLDWFDGFYRDKPVFAIATRALAGLGDITKIDMVIRGINRELDRLGIKEAKIKIFVFGNDRSKTAILTDDLQRRYPNVTFEFLAEEAIPEDSPLLKDVDALITLVRPVKEVVKFNEDQHNPRSSPVLCWTLGEYDSQVSPNPRYRSVNFSEIKTGFQQGSMGFFVNPFTIDLYNQNLKLTSEERIQQKETLVRQAINEIVKEIRGPPIDVETKTAQVARSQWGFIYMHHDGWKYLRNLTDNYSGQNATLFTFFGPNNREAASVDEYEELRGKAKELGLPVEFYDLSNNPNQINEIDFSKPVIRVINVGMRTLTTNINFMASSDFPVGVTGDESLMTAILLRKKFLYEVMSWKRNLFQNMLRNIRQVNGEDSRAAKLVEHFTGDPTAGKNQDFWNGDSFELNNEFKKFGDTTASQELYPEVVKKFLKYLAFMQLINDKSKDGSPSISKGKKYLYRGKRVIKESLLKFYNFWANYFTVSCQIGQMASSRLANWLSNKNAKSESEDKAMSVKFTYQPSQQKNTQPLNASTNGGIDFTADKTPLEIQNSGEESKFHLDPTMLQQLQNASGFVPVIINIQPMTDLRLFLGFNAASPETASNSAGVG